MNPFKYIDIEKEIKSFIKHAEKKYARKYIDDIKRYIGYARLLRDPVKLIEELTTKSQEIRLKILKVCCSFAKYLDTNYDTEVFSMYMKSFRRKAGITWSSKPSSSIVVPSEEQLVDIIRMALRESRSVALKIWVLAVSGVRPSELSLANDWSRINGLYIMLNKESRTKKANVIVLTPRLREVLEQERGNGKRTPFGVSREYEFKALVEIRKKYPWFRYYCLRHFNANYLTLKGFREAEINYLQGRAPITIFLLKHMMNLQQQ